MPKDIEDYSVGAMRLLRDDGTVGNLIDLLDDLLAALSGGTGGGTLDTSALETLIGEKQANPTTNTVLGRLKAIEDNWSGLVADGLLLKGAKLAEQQIQTDAINGVLTFADDIGYIDIFNTDAVNDGSFLVNGISILVPAGASISTGIAGTPGITVTVSGATTYIVGRYV